MKHGHINRVTAAAMGRVAAFKPPRTQPPGMPEPRVPGERGADLDLPCGRTVDVHDLDMGMREYDCPHCGATHAVVMDVHPPSRFFPEFLVDVLRETVDTTDGAEFGTLHLMGIALEEFPDEVAVANLENDGEVGYSLVWVTDFDSRRLHEILVELVVELMEHAVSHAEDGDAMTTFEDSMLEFDVAEFVDEYRERRDFTGPRDTAV